MGVDAARASETGPGRGGRASEGRQPSIAIIGAGASGIAAVVKLRRAGYSDLTVYEKASQIVGAIADRVERLTVFQRTAQWTAPLPQKTHSRRWKRFLARFPFVMPLLYHGYYQITTRWIGGAVLGDERAHRKLSEMYRKNLEQHVADPELRPKLTPDYAVACERLVICSDFYPAISRDNAELVTEGIDRIDEAGVVTDDGRHHPLDVLVFATGFDAAAFVLPIRVTGEGGVDLEKLWDGSPRAHRAMSVPGFPNFWISDYQIDYLIQCLDEMKRHRLAGLVPTREAFEQYNEQVRTALPRTIWASGGCNSWYIDPTGLPNLYPWSASRFRSDMKRPDFSEYRRIGAG